MHPPHALPDGASRVFQRRLHRGTARAARLTPPPAPPSTSHTAGNGRIPPRCAASSTPESSVTGCDSVRGFLHGQRAPRSRTDSLAPPPVGKAPTVLFPPPTKACSSAHRRGVPAPRPALCQERTPTPCAPCAPLAAMIKVTEETAFASQPTMDQVMQLAPFGFRSLVCVRPIACVGTRSPTSISLPSLPPCALPLRRTAPPPPQPAAWSADFDPPPPFLRPTRRLLPLPRDVLYPPQWCGVSLCAHCVQQAAGGVCAGVSARVPTPLPQVSQRLRRTFRACYTPWPPSRRRQSRRSCTATRARSRRSSCCFTQPGAVAADRGGWRGGPATCGRTTPATRLPSRRGASPCAASFNSWALLLPTARPLPLQRQCTHHASLGSSAARVATRLPRHSSPPR